jgi:Peptidyl-prolyl cis-trans isomerase (rotamase) - cyclophilin family
MKNLVYMLAGFLLVIGVYFLLNKEEAMPKVKITTSYGEIVIELDKENAPITTKNFLSYVKAVFIMKQSFIV